MPTHASLTDPNIHEPKDISSAPANSVYVADGAGSGDWRAIGYSDLDTGSIRGIGQYRMQTTVVDLANTSTVYVPIISDSRLDRVVLTITGAISGQDAILSFKNNGGSQMVAVTIPFASSAAGDMVDVNVTTSNTVVDGQYVQIDCDGGPTGGTANAEITMLFTLV